MALCLPEGSAIQTPRSVVRFPERSPLGGEGDAPYLLESPGRTDRRGCGLTLVSGISDFVVLGAVTAEGNKRLRKPRGGSPRCRCMVGEKGAGSPRRQSATPLGQLRMVSLSLARRACW